MSLRTLSGNALASSISTVIGALLMFELYRVLIRELGIEQIGAWALLVSSSSLIRLAECGMSGGVTRFVARDLGAGEPQQALARVIVAVLFLFTSVGLAALLSLAPIRWILTATVHNQVLLEDVLMLLPWTLAACWLTSLVTALSAALDGNQRTDLRAYAMLSGSALQLVLVYLWIPEQGLRALGPIQLLFPLFQLVLLLGFLLRIMPGVQQFDRISARPQFIEMLRYGWGIQVTAVGQLLFDPAVRWLLSIFSGLAITGYFELANKAVAQFRQIMVAAYQMLVPFLATRMGKSGASQDLMQTAYRQTFSFLLLTSVPYFALLGCALPYMLTLWLGEYSETFVWIGLICLSGWFVNMLAVPSFMLYVAVGKFRWLIATQITIGGLNIVFGLLGGTLFGGLGVATGAMLALALGSLVVVVQFHREYHVSINNVLPRCWKLLFGVSLAAVVFFAARALHWHGAGAIPMSLFFIYLGTAAALFVIVWCDPVRANLTARMFQRELPDYQGAERKAT